MVETGKEESKSTRQSKCVKVYAPVEIEPP